MLKLVRPLVMTASMGILWWVLFSASGQETLGGFTFESFIVYLLIIRFIAVFSPGAGALGVMNDEIRTGNIAMRLVRPIHYIPWLFVRELPVPLASGIIGISVVSILMWVVGASVPSGIMGVLFLLSATATILLLYAIHLFLGLLSFWIYEIWSINRLFMTFRSLLSGEMVPLSLFPIMVQGTLLLLPFASLAYIPGGIYIGLFSIQQAIQLLLIQYIWVVIGWVGVFTLYRAGLRQFEAQGG